MALELFNLRMSPNIIERLETLAESEYMAPSTLARSLLSKKIIETERANRGRK